MRIEPGEKYYGMPCSYVGTGCAYEDIVRQTFIAPLPENVREDGYLTLEAENRYLRSILHVRKKVYFKRGERPKLRDFLKDNKEKCCVCVLGHFVYVNGCDYWSFFNNEDDAVVCIWYL
jgi:hypothetical protein